MKILLIVLASIFGLIILLLVCPTKVGFFFNENSDNGIRLYIEILGIRIKLWPRKIKKKKAKKHKYKPKKEEDEQMIAPQLPASVPQAVAPQSAETFASQEPIIQEKTRKTKKGLFDFSEISVEKIMSWLKLAGEGIGGIRRILKIDKLKIYASVATSDPANTAIAYGSAAAAVNLGLPALRKIIKIRKTDIFVTSAFDKTQTDIEFGIVISAVLLAMIILGIKLFFKFLKINKGGVL